MTGKFYAIYLVCIHTTHRYVVSQINTNLHSWNEHLGTNFIFHKQDQGLSLVNEREHC